MTRRHAVLEATLKALADDFASRVARATMRAPVTELGEAFDAVELRRMLLTTLARLVVEPAPQRSPPTRPQPHPRGPRVQRSAKRERPPREERGAGAITDPNLLLQAMEQERRVPAALPTPARAPTAPSASTGPQLRPGERLQRTTGGGLVVRRPGK